MPRTKEGLPVVTEQTFLDFLQTYNIADLKNDPEVTKRIEIENPEIHRILSIGMKGAPSREAKSYYEMGMQIVYELLRMQSVKEFR